MVVVSGAGVERDCRRDVKDLGFTCYQPVERIVVVKRGRKTHVERLLMGRYLFARWDESIPWRQILGLRRVFGLLMQVDAELPAFAHDGEIERIRAAEDRNGFVQVDAARASGFRPGQRVRAASGTFIGFTGEFVEHRRDGDWAELVMFGRRTRIGFNPGVLQAA